MRISILVPAAFLQWRLRTRRRRAVPSGPDGTRHSTASRVARGRGPACTCWKRHARGEASPQRQIRALPPGGAYPARAASPGCRDRVQGQAPRQVRGDRRRPQRAQCGTAHARPGPSLNAPPLEPEAARTSRPRGNAHGLAVAGCLRSAKPRIRGRAGGRRRRATPDLCRPNRRAWARWLRCGRFGCCCQQQSSPRQDWSPAQAAAAAMGRPMAGSAHQAAGQRAVTARPSRTAAAWAAHR
jgi:hypothetical protein